MPTAVKPLLNEMEQTLFGRLVRAFPGHVVLSHVALSRLLDGERDIRADTAKGGLTERVADFVVCRADFSVLAVIDLNCAGTGLGATRRQSDEDLRAAGIKVVHVGGRDLPGEAALKALVAALPLHATTGELLRRVS